MYRLHKPRKSRNTLFTADLGHTVQIHITLIEWDTDDATPDLEDLPELPDELWINHIEEGIEDPAEDLADWISDKYGWCVKGFHFETVPDLMGPNQIWVLATNNDYHETSAAFKDPRLAVLSIAQSMGMVDELETSGASEDFWGGVEATYSYGKWKGLTVHQLDTKSLEMTLMEPEDLTFSREDMESVLPQQVSPEPEL